MSPTKANKAPGVVARPSANRITCTFSIDGNTYEFDATLNPSLPPFTSKSAWVYYDSIDDLTSTHTYQGFIGAASYSITLNNGPVIEGDLNFPNLESKNQVDGSGSWVQS